jgi:hypothetical protein
MDAWWNPGKLILVRIYIYVNVDKNIYQENIMKNNLIKYNNSLMQLIRIFTWINKRLNVKDKNRLS